MPQVGWLIQDSKGEWREVEYGRLMEYAKNYPQNFDYTPEMLEGMFRHFERDYMSPTMLGDCPREVVLKRHLDYWVPLEYAWPAYRGTIGHAIMESSKNEPDAILEKRLTCEFVLKPTGETWIIKGTPDKVLPSQKLLVDYKTLDKTVITAKKSWTPQLSAYRWMLHQHGIEIDRAIIQEISMTHPLRLEIDLWPLQKSERWLNARITRFKGAFNGDYYVQIGDRGNFARVINQVDLADLVNMVKLPPILDQTLEADVAWKCVSRNNKPAWCAVAKECMELHRKGL